MLELFTGPSAFYQPRYSVLVVHHKVPTNKKEVGIDLYNVYFEQVWTKHSNFMEYDYIF